MTDSLLNIIWSERITKIEIVAVKNRRVVYINSIYDKPYLLDESGMVTPLKEE